MLMQAKPFCTAGLSIKATTSRRAIHSSACARSLLAHETAALHRQGRLRSYL
jgi:hypothetical protein